MVYIRSRKFCCCLPVRFGVFILTIIGLLGGASVAIASWVRVKQLHENPLDDHDRNVLYGQAVVYSLITIISFFGLVGTIIKNRPCVKAYWILIFSLFILSVVTGILTLRSVFKDKSPEAVQKCIDGSTAELKEKACKAAGAVGRGLSVAIYVITWLIQLYGVVIVNNYAEQLGDEQEANLPYSHKMPARHPETQPMQPMYPAGAPGINSGYPFAGNYNRVPSHVQ